MNAPPADDNLRRRVEIGVFVLLAALIATSVGGSYSPYSFLHGDGAFYANINRSIAEDLSLVQDDIHPRSWLERDLGWNRTLDQGWSNVSLGADGATWYPKHPFLMPIVSTPFYVLLGLPGLLIFNALATLLTLLLAYRVAARLAPPALAAAVVVAFALSPIFVRTAYSYSNDIFYAALVLAGVETFLSERWRWAGVCLGLAVWAKATNVFFVLPLFVCLLAARRWRPALAFSVACAVPVGVYAVANWVMFGAPWLTSYDRIIIRSEGAMALESVKERFRTPFPQGFRQLISVHGEGLRANVPVFFLALPGLVVLFWRRLGLALVITASLVGYVLFYAPYEYVYARFFLPWAGLGVLLGALLLEVLARLGRRAWEVYGGTNARRRRRVATIALAAAALLAVVVVWGVKAHRAGDGRRLADHVARAEVYLDDIPCDYFNLSQQKWECTSYDANPLEYAGTALNGQCGAGQADAPKLWLCPSPRKMERRMVFRDLPPTARVTITAARPASERRGPPVELTITAGDAELASLALAAPGDTVVEKRETPELAAGGGTLTVRLPGGMCERRLADGRQALRAVCLGIDLHPPE